MSASQGVLFAEPNYSETGVRCELSPSIDPAEWAHLCRHIGSLTPKQLRKVQKEVYGSPDSILNRLRGMFCFEPWETDGVPVVCWGRMGKEIFSVLQSRYKMGIIRRYSRIIKDRK